MKRMLFAVAVLILALPMYQPLYAQDGIFGGDSVDLSGLLGGGDRGGGNRGGRGNVQIPVSADMVSEIKGILSKGKKPLEKDQENMLKSMLNKEITDLTDRIQLLRNNNNGNFNNGNFNNPQEQQQGGRGARGGGQPANN